MPYCVQREDFWRATEKFKAMKKEEDVKRNTNFYYCHTPHGAILYQNVWAPGGGGKLFIFVVLFWISLISIGY